MARSAIVFFLGFAGLAHGQACTPGWSNQFSTRAPNRSVRAAVNFDNDGPGPNPGTFVIGGAFDTIDEVSLNHIAQWDGAAWQPLGPGLPGEVLQLAVFDEDGAGAQAARLAATYRTAASQNSAAVFDGTAWTLLSHGFNNTSSVAGYSGAGPGGSSLFFAGYPAVFRYSAGTLTQIASVNGDVLATCVIDHDGAGPQSPLLYIGGGFSTVNSLPISRLARWDGVSWSAIPGATPDADVRAMAAHDPDGDGPAPVHLAVGGPFTSVAPGTSEALALWSGSAWVPIPSPGPWLAAAHSVDFDGSGPQPPSLLVGGGVPNGVRAWNGAEWSAMGAGFNEGIECIASAPAGAAPHVVVGGNFTSGSGGAFQQTVHVARWAGTSWVAMGPGENDGANDTVRELHAPVEAQGLPLGAVVAAGRFGAVGDQAASRVAVWSNGAWSTLGAGLTGEIWALGEFDLDGPGPQPRRLLAGGIHAINGSQVQAWNGQTWSPVGALQNLSPRAFATYDSDGPGPNAAMLYTVGDNPGSPSVVRRWESGSWSPVLNVPVPGRAYSIAVFDIDGTGPGGDLLIVGGADLLNGSEVVAWNGTSWASVGTLTGGPVRALAVFDDDGSGPAAPRLFAGGSFTNSGVLRVDGVARWNGASWERVGAAGGGGLLPVQFNEIKAMTAFDADGPGGEPEALYVTGNFDFALSQTVRVTHLAKWTGAAWLPVGGGLDYAGGEALQVADDDALGPGLPNLFIGGRFRNAGDQSSLHIARWGCASSGSACYANCDQSTVAPILNVADFTCFLQRFAAGEPYANCDGSTTFPTLNVADFTCFLQQFAAGCP